jgi:hypothetical protein
MQRNHVSADGAVGPGVCGGIDHLRIAGGDYLGWDLRFVGVYGERSLKSKGSTPRAGETILQPFELNVSSPGGPSTGDSRMFDWQMFLRTFLFTFVIGTVL